MSPFTSAVQFFIFQQNVTNSFILFVNMFQKSAYMMHFKVSTMDSHHKSVYIFCHICTIFGHKIVTLEHVPDYPVYRAKHLRKHTKPGYSDPWQTILHTMINSPPFTRYLLTKSLRLSRFQFMLSTAPSTCENTQNQAPRTRDRRYRPQRLTHYLLHSMLGPVTDDTAYNA